MVLLAIKYPFSFRRSANFSSVKGLDLSSLEIASFRMVLTSLVETSSPDLVVRDSLKKYFNKKEFLIYGFLFLLGIMQGLIGWWMVKSGQIDDPFVSAYRLTFHLTNALIILDKSSKEKIET